MAYRPGKEPAAALIALLALVWAADAAAELPGRLFFTPAQRAELDRARLRGEPPPEPPAPPVPPGAKAPEAPAPPELITVDGVVRARDRAVSVWINKRSRDLEVAPTPVPGDPSAVRIDLGEHGGLTELRVGQRLDRATGQVVEPYQIPAAPQVEQAPAAPPTPAAPPREAATRKPAPDEDEAEPRRQ